MPTKGVLKVQDSGPFQSCSQPSRKEAIQKTIMSMTLGKDVSALFPDVLKNIATADLDQKKLVYLYLMFVLHPVWARCASTKVHAHYSQELRKITS